jgi:hypothetical protein
MAETTEKSLLDLDFASLTRRTFTPSPAAWEDQVVYFLLLDRFSDGNERGGYGDGEGRPAAPRLCTGPTTPAGSITRRGSAPAAVGRVGRSEG